MPQQKPGRSKQDYETPADFMRALKHTYQFDEFAFDLAATATNTKAERFFTPEQNSLAQDWSKLRGRLWLNPPYANIEPWARQCWETKQANSKCSIFLLAPAGVGSNWFARWVHDKAFVVFLNGRLTFVGETACYPKDHLLCLYGPKPGYGIWRWQETYKSIAAELGIPKQTSADF